MTIEIATIINWTNGIALLGFIPLLIDIVVKYRLFKKSENFDFNEIFDFDFFKSLVIGILIFVFALFENSSKQTEKATLSNKISGLKTELETIHSKDSAKSVLDRKVDKTEILTGIGNAIGKYSLGYDSAKNEIIKLRKLIRDSGNKGEIPTVTFGSRGIQVSHRSRDSLKYTISIESYSTSSILKDATIYVLYSNNTIGGIFKDLKFGQKTLFISNLVNLTKENPVERGFAMYGSPTNNIKSLIVLIKGNYTDSRGDNNRKLNEVGFLNVDKNEFSELVSPYDDDVIDFLKNKNILDK